MSRVQVVVGRLGRAHGLRGEVSVDVRTDEPEVRFAVGKVLGARSDLRPALTVAAARAHGGRLLVRFAEVSDRTQAESLGGVELFADVPDDDVPADPDEFYDRQLVGLTVRTTDDETIGTVSEVQHLPAQDLLVVESPARVHLIPFVAALVPEVDLAAGVVRVRAVPGLLDDDEPTDDQPRPAGH